jgi:hypothetical protein
LRRGGLARLGDHLRAARGRVPLPEAGEVGAHSSGGPGARGASSRQRDCLSLLSRSLGPFRRRAAFLFACTAELSLLLSFATRSGGVVVLFFLLSS